MPHSIRGVHPFSFSSVSCELLRAASVRCDEEKQAVVFMSASVDHGSPASASWGEVPASYRPVASDACGVDRLQGAGGEGV